MPHLKLCENTAHKGDTLAIPDYQTLMLPVLRLAAQGEMRVPEAAQKIADQFGLSDEEREEMLPSNRQRVLHNRIHWAKFYMSKAGLIESPKRGLFRASTEGQAMLAKNPTTIDNETLKAYPAFVAFQQASASGQTKSEKPVATAASVSPATPEEQIDAAQAVLHSALSSDLLQRILDNSPLFFEHLIVDLLVAMGYGGSHENAALKLGKSGDNGVDGVIDEDRLGLDRIYVQAKRYAETNSVQRPEVQGFVGSLVGFGANKGVFVTTSSFSSGARQYAEQIPQRIILIDGVRLTDLMIEHDVGVRISRAVKVKRIDEDFFVEG
ncbi:restriction endonuclease [Tsuneonella troitsensis]|uniref:restriction endonuclease n=1 Tax=Tsuneonella troitsensis TaxID=292222 RepID=UPI000AD6F2F9|nr:restriction endonuclease [Tsuneonella troitsensis]